MLGITVGNVLWKGRAKNTLKTPSPETNKEAGGSTITELTKTGDSNPLAQGPFNRALAI